MSEKPTTTAACDNLQQDEKLLEVTAASYLCGDCGHADRGPVAELVARMTDHWRSHRD